jgi:tellurite resistance protein TerC
VGAPASVTFPFWAWAVFVGLVVALLFLDLFVLHRKAKEIPFKEALWLSGFWIAVSLAFGAFVWLVGGADAGGRYLTAYLVEKSLSVDNVFVFAVIFSGLAVPEKYRYHVLFWGVIGALVFRLLFILAGTALLSTFSWLVYVFGAFLVFTGIRLLRGGGNDEETDPQDNRALKLLRRVLPFTEDYRGDRFFVSENGKRYATPLLAALVVIEASDVIFAIDSVPAVLSLTQTTFVAYSAMAFAVLGLRALYFALEGLVDRFVYLHYGLAAILIFLGAEFILQGFGIHVPIYASLLFIAAVITASVVVSLKATRGDGKADK